MIGQTTDWWSMVSAAAAVVVPLSTLLWTYTLSRVKNVIAANNDILMGKINGTYIRSYGSKLTGHEIGRRLDSIDGKFDKLDTKLDGITVLLSRMVGCPNCHPKHRQKGDI